MKLRSVGCNSLEMLLRCKNTPNKSPPIKLPVCKYENIKYSGKITIGINQYGINLLTKNLSLFIIKTSTIAGNKKNPAQVVKCAAIKATINHILKINFSDDSRYKYAKKDSKTKNTTRGSCTGVLPKYIFIGKLKASKLARIPVFRFHNFEPIKKIRTTLPEVAKSGTILVDHSDIPNIL